MLYDHTTNYVWVEEPQRLEQWEYFRVKAISQFMLKYFLLHRNSSPVEALGGVKLKLHIFKTVDVNGSHQDQDLVHFLSSSPMLVDRSACT